MSKKKFAKGGYIPANSPYSVYPVIKNEQIISIKIQTALMADQLKKMKQQMEGFKIKAQYFDEISSFPGMPERQPDTESALWDE